MSKKTMVLSEYSKATQKMVKAFAKERGVTADEVLHRFNQLYSGKELDKNEKPIFADVDTQRISFTTDGDAVVVRIGGNAFENLRKIADAMNAVSWCDKDNTPITVAKFWVGSLLDLIGEQPGNAESVADVTCDIADGIDTGFPNGSPEDEIRRSELRGAFRSVGLL